jgi:hypothetical protein
VPFESKWFPGTESCKNYRETIFINGKQSVGKDSVSVEGEKEADLGSFAGWAAE